MKREWIRAGILGLAALSLAGCGTAARVVLSSEPGAIAALTGAGTYTSGQEVTVSVQPDAGWEFISWTQGGKVVADTQDYTFTVRGKVNLVANLKPVEYAVHALAQGTGSFRYAQDAARHGQDYTVTAIPGQGNSFICWTEKGEIVSWEAEYTFPATGHRELTAVFWPTVALEVGEGGRVEKAFSLSPTPAVNLRAIPQGGYEFFDWVDKKTGREVGLKEELSLAGEKGGDLLVRFRKKLLPADGSSLIAVVGKQTTIGQYAPGDLVTLPSELSTKRRWVRREAAEALALMAEAAKTDGVRLNVDSGYRGYTEQKDLFNRYAERDGVLEAERYSARPGQSEHQLGTVMDFGGTNRDYSDAFADTDQGKWLLANAHQYGFALSYPRGAEQITGYTYEPWHYRYIGVELALEWKGSGLTLIEFLHLKNKSN